MKKNIGVIAAAILAAAALTACGTSKTAETSAAESSTAAAETSTAESSEAAEETTGDLEDLTVGASPAPHAEILEAAREELATKLVSAGKIHYEPFGIYAGKTASLDELADGAKVAVPNDATNEARALLLLEAQGLLKLADGAGLKATKTDIVENPKNLDILEVEAAQVPRSLPDVDVAVINGNYAIEAGLKVSDALAVEASDSEAATTYGNVVAVKEGKEEDAKTKALIEALTSDAVKEYMEQTYEGAVVPLF